MRPRTRHAIPPILAALIAGNLIGNSRGQVLEPPRADPKVWAVVVGIDDYEKGAIPDCPGAIQDARALGEWLRSDATWGPTNVLLLHDGGQTGAANFGGRVPVLAPTKENLEKATTMWLARHVRSGDVVVFYFAGQAAVTPSQREVLLPIEADPSDLDRSGWSPEEALDELAARRRCAVICLLDTSLHGRGRPFAPGPAAPERSATERLLHRMTRWPGSAVWLAADGRPSEGGDRQKRSPFVSALLKSLGEKPDTLLSNLSALQSDPALRAQGFRSRGGISPRLSLWPNRLLPAERFDPVLVPQRGHSAEVNSVAITADGSRLITASQDSSVRIWRISGSDRTLLAVLDNFTVGVTAMSLSPNGRYVAAADGHGLVRAWDLVDNRAIPLNGARIHPGRVEQLVFDPSGASFVTRDQNGRCARWHISTKGPQLEAEVLVPSGAKGLVVSPDREDKAPFFVALNDAGAIARFPADGPFDRPERFETAVKSARAMAVSPSGLLAMADRRGSIFVRDLTRPDRPELAPISQVSAAITGLAFARGGWLAIASGRRVDLVDSSRGGDTTNLGTFDHKATSLVTSRDGRWLAATTLGEVALWDLDDPSKPVPIPLPVSPGSTAGPTSLAFSSDDRRLVAGEGDGGVRIWDLPERRERGRIEPSRGQVAHLDVSPGGRYLLQIDLDGVARVWDLEERGGPRTIPGRFKDGAFLPPLGKDLAMLQSAKDGGRVVVVNRDRDTPASPVIFKRPTLPGGAESNIDFARVAVSPDGRWIAASATPGRDEAVFVWDLKGDLPRWRLPHLRAINDLQFSPDSRDVMTVCDDNAVRLFRIAGPDAASEARVTLRPKATSAGAIPPVLSAGRLDPSGRARMVVSSWSPDGPGGDVMLVSWDPKDPAPKEARWSHLGYLEGRVHAIEFTTDGLRVMAAGNSRRMRAWELPADPTKGGPREIALDGKAMRPHHTEQVNALASWPDRPQIASGSDDATTRFWRLDAPDGRLLGSLVTARPGKAEEWLAFTPEGAFDGSRDGDRLVSFVLGGEVRPLEQFTDQYFQFGITQRFRNGESPGVRPPAELPGLTIDPPPQRETETRGAKLEISLADPKGLNLEGLRLYQNGVPIKAGEQDFTIRHRGETVVAQADVLLRSGPNRFYAMASRPEGIDARSGDVEIAYNGADRAGKTHVVALGVSDYAKEAKLKFAHKDAEALGRYLHEHGVALPGDNPAPQPGELVILQDRGVNAKALEDAFTRVRQASRNRPEDTVVIFLAGHTDILSDRNKPPQFCLLLPSFPFPDDGRIMVGMRGLRGGAEAGVFPRGSFIPYADIYRDLTHVHAQQRLIIVDACQAEAILDDPGVLRVREILEKDSRKTRNAYYFAARSGEPAGEDPILEHGLLTYTLLWGMGAPDLKSPEGEEVSWRTADADADSNGDRVITTDELRSFVERHLPQLNRRLPELALRAGRKLSDRPGRGRLQIQNASARFPIVALPAVGGK